MQDLPKRFIRKYKDVSHAWHEAKSSTRGDFVLWGHLEISGDSMGCHSLVGAGNTTSIWCVESTDAAKRPTVDKTTHNKEEFLG